MRVSLNEVSFGYFDIYPDAFLCVLLLLHCANSGWAMHSTTSNVVSLSDKDFDSKVIKSDGIWLV
jgi:hypothetical protein